MVSPSPLKNISSLMAGCLSDSVVCSRCPPWSLAQRGSKKGAFFIKRINCDTLYAPRKENRTFLYTRKFAKQLAKELVSSTKRTFMIPFTMWSPMLYWNTSIFVLREKLFKTNTSFSILPVSLNFISKWGFL